MHLSLMPITLAGASAAETVAAAARAGYDSVGVTLWQPGAPDPGAALGSVREIKEELRSSGIALLAEGANERGIRLGLEWISRLHLRTLGQALRMIERAGVPGIQLVYDPLHLHRSGGTAAELRAVPRDKAGYAQICDAPFDKPPPQEYLVEGRSNRMYPGEGGLPLGDFLDALPEGIALGVEVPNKGTAGLSADERAQLAIRRTRAFLARWAGSQAG